MLCLFSSVLLWIVHMACYWKTCNYTVL